MRKMEPMKQIEKAFNALDVELIEETPVEDLRNELEENGVDCAAALASIESLLSQYEEKEEEPTPAGSHIAITISSVSATYQENEKASSTRVELPEETQKAAPAPCAGEGLSTTPKHQPAGGYWLCYGRSGHRVESETPHFGGAVIVYFGTSRTAERTWIHPDWWCAPPGLGSSPLEETWLRAHMAKEHSLADLWEQPNHNLAGLHQVTEIDGIREAVFGACAAGMLAGMTGVFLPLVADALFGRMFSRSGQKSEHQVFDGRLGTKRHRAHHHRRMDRDVLIAMDLPGKHTPRFQTLTPYENTCWQLFHHGHRNIKYVSHHMRLDMATTCNLLQHIERKIHQERMLKSNELREESTFPERSENTNPNTDSELNFW